MSFISFFQNGLSSLREGESSTLVCLLLSPWLIRFLALSFFKTRHSNTSQPSSSSWDLWLSHDRQSCGSDAVERLCVVLEASNVHLLHDDDCFELIMDTGRSKICCAGHSSNFAKGLLVDPAIPVAVDGIARLLTSHQKGKD